MAKKVIFYIVFVKKIWNLGKYAPINNPTPEARNILKKFSLILFLAFFLFSCTNSYVYSNIKMRPELSQDETEIYEVYGGGNGFASYEQLGYSIRKTAAQKSKSEGYDCFLLIDSNDETAISQITTTRTMYGKSNTYGSAGYQTDYYSRSGNYLGNSTGSVYGSSQTNYSYQVPETHNISKPTSSWYVTFHEEDECNSLKKTKWRDRIYFNDNAIEQSTKYEQSNDKMDVVVTVVGIGLIGILTAVLLSADAE